MLRMEGQGTTCPLIQIWHIYAFCIHIFSLVMFFDSCAWFYACLLAQRVKDMIATMNENNGGYYYLRVVSYVYIIFFI